MTGTAGDGLASAFEELLESPQGELLSATSDMLRSHMKAFVALFFLTMVVGYPLAGEAVEWLLEQDSNLRPSGIRHPLIVPPRAKHQTPRRRRNASCDPTLIPQTTFYVGVNTEDWHR